MTIMRSNVAVKRGEAFEVISAVVERVQFPEQTIVPREQTAVAVVAPYRPEREIVMWDEV